MCDHISLLINPSNEVSFGQLFDQLKDPLKTMSQAGDLLFTFANLSFTIGLDLTRSCGSVTRGFF